ncbi:uncharacterized protein LOC129610087 [Condylostylus longicornis]|uniref:uncharacterized protein LOC129610087 n=1 Tax=Condylostylus longicornis TaxID=2530218 RepID=UPI00244D9D58|nr:uncharacterized protein LOC129610087 [Condylostylus longicornis]
MIRKKESNVKDLSHLTNFVTPLVGHYLNLPDSPAIVQCPSCGVTAETIYEMVFTPSAERINTIFTFFYMLFCCCLCCRYCFISKKQDGNHYCSNCGCFFGRYLPKKKRIEIKK